MNSLSGYKISGIFYEYVWPSKDAMNSEHWPIQYTCKALKISYVNFNETLNLID